MARYHFTGPPEKVDETIDTLEANGVLVMEIEGRLEPGILVTILDPIEDKLAEFCKLKYFDDL